MSAPAGFGRLGRWFGILALTAAMAGGCVDTLLVPPGPDDDPEANFDQLWKEVDRHYAFFDESGVDWNALYDEYRPQVSATTSDRELFGVMSEMLDRLGDRHSSLTAPFGQYFYVQQHDDYPANFDWPLAKAQIVPPVRVSSNSHIVYGRLNDDVGYIYLPVFDERWAGDMDRVLDDLSGVKALVLDVRSNVGGSTNALPAIIGRFVDERRVYARHQYRDGPAHADFSRMFESVIEPRGARFSGPVAVLTNRKCFSTTEDFVLAVNALPTMFTVGDTTGGALGNPINRELPNGWVFTVSRWKTFVPDGTRVFEGVGIAPDYLTQLDQVDVDRGLDTIISRAVELLEARLKGGE